MPRQAAGKPATRTTFRDARVKAVFAAYPAPLRSKLLALRRLILETAKTTDGVGPLEETLKWGQPSYLTRESGSGSTIRIDRTPSDHRYAIYFHCQTDLVATFRGLYPDDMIYEGNRAIVLDAADVIPQDAMRHCIGLALTYHSRRKAGAKPAKPSKPKEPAKPKRPGVTRRARPS